MTPTKSSNLKALLATDAGGGDAGFTLEVRLYERLWSSIVWVLGDFQIPMSRIRHCNRISGMRCCRLSSTIPWWRT